MTKKYLSSDTMYKIDQFTINDIGLPSPVLMERAAYSVFLDIKAKISKDVFILLVAGSGNNGGDAVALARMLYLAGYNTKLYVTSKGGYSEGMALQMKIAENINLPLTFEYDEALFKNAAYIVDGIFGIGLSREIEGEYRPIIETINQQTDTSVAALDIPSGFSAKTGEAFETVVKADVTYTFGFLKKGMDTSAGQEICGRIITCDLGYPVKILEENELI
jgi:NAD(P)H-hydrate epimerase